jgi:cytoskeletal protein CcmA (bactofilin family)
MVTSSAPKDANTIIGENSLFEGIFKTIGTLHIAGTFEGTSLKANQVYILPTGKVKATIKAESVFVEGIIEGSIYAKSRVFLLPGSHIIGDIVTPELITQKGVILDGHCRIQQEVNLSF